MNVVLQTCKKCHKEKELDKFQLNYSKSKGVRNRNSHTKICKQCVREGIQQKKYGLTDEQMREVYKHGNVCVICQTTIEDLRFLHMDHDHETHVIRGLLCHRCNRQVGIIETNKNEYDRLIAYIQGAHLNIVPAAEITRANDIRVVASQKKRFELRKVFPYIAIVQSPDGNQHKTSNLTAFCRANDISYAYLARTIKSKTAATIGRTNGWIILEKKTLPVKSPTPRTYKRKPKQAESFERVYTPPPVTPIPKPPKKEKTKKAKVIKPAPKPKIVSNIPKTKAERRAYVKEKIWKTNG